jgi:hypothetical protein
MNKASGLPSGLVSKGAAQPAKEIEQGETKTQPARVKHTWFSDAGIERRLDAYLYEQKLQGNKISLQDTMTMFILEGLDRRRA